MKRLLFDRWFLLAMRLIIGGIFIYAGIIKIQQPLNFADSIASFRMIPSHSINIFVLGLPPLEVIVGLMLIFNWKSRLAALAIFLLTVVFAIALGQALIRGLEVDCGCFGSGKPSILKTGASLGRDILLMVGSSWLYIANLANEAKGTLNASLD